MPLSAQRLSGIYQFWVVLLVPCLLDLLGGRGILASVFGAGLWGMALVIAAAKPRTHEASFRSRQGKLLAFLSGAWLAYWGLAFIEAPRHISAPAPVLIKSLTWAHAGLLTAGLGMVLVLCVASAVWIFQYRRLRKSSWERRQSKSRLPSLEALGSICDYSVKLAFSIWGLGLFLAILTAILRWQPSDEGIPMAAWWLDTRVLAAALLWLGLAATFQMSLVVSKGGLWLYRTYLAFSLLFMFFFSRFMLESHSLMHEPLSWFI